MHKNKVRVVRVKDLHVDEAAGAPNCPLQKPISVKQMETLLMRRPEAQATCAVPAEKQRKKTWNTATQAQGLDT